MSSIPSESFLRFITHEHSEGELRSFSFQEGRVSKSLRAQTKISKNASMENCQRVEHAAIALLHQDGIVLDLKQVVALEKNLHTIQHLTQNQRVISQANDLIYEKNLGGLKTIQEKGLHNYVAIIEEAADEAAKDGETLDFSEVFGTVSVPPIHLILETVDIVTEINPELARGKIKQFIRDHDSESLSTLITCVIPFVTDLSAVNPLSKNQNDPERIQSVAFSILTTLLAHFGKQESPEWAAFRAGLRDRTF